MYYPRFTIRNDLIEFIKWIEVKHMTGFEDDFARCVTQVVQAVSRTTHGRDKQQPTWLEQRI